MIDEKMIERLVIAIESIAASLEELANPQIVVAAPGDEHAAWGQR